MSHFKRKELRFVDMFRMILIVTQVSSFKRILFKFRNGRHVFNAFILSVLQVPNQNNVYFWCG